MVEADGLENHARKHKAADHHAHEHRALIKPPDTL